MSRRLTNRRGVAAAATSGALAVAGIGVIALAPAANADTVHANVTCVLPAGQGSDTGNQDISIDMTPATVAPGGLVTATVTLGLSPASSPIALSNVQETPSITLDMHGGATGQVTITGPTTTMNVPANQPIPSVPYTGTFNLPNTASGPITFTPTSMTTVATVPGLGSLPTVCTLNSGQDQTVSTVTAQGSTGAAATVTVPATVRTGASFALGGTGFTPGATPQVSLCDASGNNCSTTDFTATGAAIDASGNLTGTIAVPAFGTPVGTYTVKVFDGAKTATSGSIAISTFVPTGDPVIHATPTSGPVGTVVTVTGSNLPPNTPMIISPLNAAGKGIGAPAHGTTDPDGNLPATTITVTNPATAEFKVWASGVTPTMVPFSIGIDQTQTATATLNAGSLSLTQAGSGIDFGSATLNGTPQTLKANLNELTVTDARGGNLGWSLTGTMTDLTAANGTDKIPAGNVSWTPTCTASAASLSTVTTGAAGALGSTPSTLCSQAADATQATGGSFTADAAMTLTTPAFAAAGTYTGTLTLSLS